MKKSTLFMVIAIAGTLATMTIVNLKLKSEYTKGNFHNPYVKKSLPPFHFIREELDSVAARELSFDITVNNSEQSGMSEYYNRPPKLLYKVLNDTLIISSDPLDKRSEHTRNPVKIHTPSLKGIQVSNGNYKIQYNDSSKLSVSLAGRSNAIFRFAGIRSLDLSASEQAKVSLTSKNTIDEANIRLDDRSALTIDDFAITRKTIQLGDSVTLQLGKRAIADFAISRSVKQ